jgi:hypothetical protein
MLKSLVASVILMMLGLATAGCAAAPREGTNPVGAALRPTAFESWAVGNGTGSFFRPVGPAQGAGVRHAWPE